MPTLRSADAKPDPAVSPGASRAAAGGPSRTLRAVARCGVLFVGGIALLIVVGEVEQSVLGRERIDARAILWAGPIVLVAIVAALALARSLAPRGEEWAWSGLAAYERPRWSTRPASGTPFTSGTQFAFGTLLGGGLIALAAMVGWTSGLYAFAGTERAPPGALFALVSFALLATVAAAGIEELVFRGGLFTEALRRLPPWGAIVAVSIPFALVHFDKDGFGAGYLVSVVVLSILFCTLRLRSGSLWMPIGFHGGWNAMQYNLLGIGASELPANGHALVQFERTGSVLWLGDGTAIEGGLLVGGIAVAATMVAVWAWLRADVGRTRRETNVR